MDVRLGLAATLLAVSGCGVEPATPPQPTAEPAATSYADPSPQQDRLARRFTTAALEYDARHHRRRAFLAMVAPWTTEDELRRLARSERANLNWSALRARHEHTDVHVTGVSRLPGRTDDLAVTATITTRSTVGTVRQFVLVNLQVEEQDGRTLIIHASGAGL
jgi:hypothetical protein